MIVGSCLNEFAGLAAVVTPDYFGQSDDQIMQTLTKTYGEDTQTYVKAFKKTYPQLTTAYMPLIDFKYRPQALKQTETKAKDEGAPVWNFLFTYQSTALDGTLTAMHCMELPYVFNNVTRCGFETEATSEAIKLGDIMSSAWLNFAHTGNPNGNGVPQWPAFTTKKKATMIFDKECEVKYNFDAELQQIGTRKR